MPDSPAARSLAHLRKQGYLSQVVERWNAYAKIRQDLFGCIDILAVHPDYPGVLGVQTTTESNLSNRIHKILALPQMYVWLSAGNRFEFHGWRKLGPRGHRKTWEVDVRNITQQDLPPFPGMPSPHHSSSHRHHYPPTAPNSSPHDAPPTSQTPTNS